MEQAQGTRASSWTCSWLCPLHFVSMLRPLSYTFVSLSGVALVLQPHTLIPNTAHQSQRSACSWPSRAFLSKAFITEGYLRLMNSLNNLMQPVLSQSWWFGSHIAPHGASHVWWEYKKTCWRKDHVPKGQRQFDTRALHRPCPKGPPLKAWHELVYKGGCTEMSPCLARSLNSLRNPKCVHTWHAAQARALLCVRQDTLISSPLCAEAVRRFLLVPLHGIILFSCPMTI